MREKGGGQKRESKNSGRERRAMRRLRESMCGGVRRAREKIKG